MDRGSPLDSSKSLIPNTTGWQGNWQALGLTLKSLRTKMIKMIRIAAAPRIMISGKYQKTSLSQVSNVLADKFLLTVLTDTITMASVRTIIGQMSTRELPGNIPFAAHEHFDTLFGSKWKSISLNSFEMVEQLLREMVQSLC